MSTAAATSIAWTLWLRRSVGVAGMASLALGILVTAGWHMESSTLIQVIPGFSPMAYNTALCFSACGAGLALLVAGRPRLAGALGTFSALLGLLTAIQQFGSWNLGVDQLFHHASASFKVESQGLMAASTAVCFFLVGASLVQLGFWKGFRYRAVLLSIAASIVMVLGLMSIIGYLTDTRDLLAWGHASYMSIHAAVAMVGLSFTLFAIAWNDGREAFEGYPEWLPIPISCIVLLLSLVGWQALSVLEHVQIQRNVQARLQFVSYSLQSGMDERVLALRRMATRLELGRGMTEENWVSDASQYVAHYAGYQALEWVDRDLVVRWVAPRQGNESALGVDIRENAKRRKTFEDARAAGNPALTTPVWLAQGGEGYLLCVPVAESGGSPGGFIVAVFHSQYMLHSLLPKGLTEGYAVTIQQDGRTIYSPEFTKGDPGLPGFEQRQDLQVYGRKWTILLRPTLALLKQAHSTLSTYVLLGGGMVGILLGITTYLAQKARRDRLELAASTLELQAVLARQSEILESTKNMELILVEREARFRTLIENGSDVICITSVSGAFMYISPSLTRVLGWTQDELLGRGFQEFIAPEDEAAIEAQYRALVGSTPGSSGSFLCRFTAKDGTYRYVDVQSRNQISNPLIEGVVSVLRDVTDRIRAEESLSRERDFTNAIVETVGALVIVTDWEGRIARFNRACETVTGYAAVEVLGRQFWEVFIPEGQRKAVAAEFISKKASDYPNSNVSVWVTKLGEERHFEWSDTALLDENGQPEFVIATGLDITERERAAEALRQTEKLKNEFVSTVSHELRTPLTSIRGSLGLMAGGVAGALSDQGKALLDIAIRNSDRLGRLVNDILDIEKIESGRLVYAFRDLDLRAVLEQAIEANRSYGEPLGVRFELGSVPDGARVRADEDRLMQVLANLLSNAAKYSPRGETVFIWAERRAPLIRVSVRDRGAGIPEEFKGRMFQRFAQADSSDTKQKGGTGLGLAVSKAIVEGHQGAIDFEKAEGGGTIFYFEIPELVA